MNGLLFNEKNIHGVAKIPWIIIHAIPLFSLPMGPGAPGASVPQKNTENPNHPRDPKAPNFSSPTSPSSLSDLHVNTRRQPRTPAPVPSPASSLASLSAVRPVSSGTAAEPHRAGQAAPEQPLPQPPREAGCSVTQTVPFVVKNVKKNHPHRYVPFAPPPQSANDDVSRVSPPRVQPFRGGGMVQMLVLGGTHKKKWILGEIIRKKMSVLLPQVLGGEHFHDTGRPYPPSISK